MGQNHSILTKFNPHLNFIRKLNRFEGHSILKIFLDSVTNFVDDEVAITLFNKLSTLTKLKFTIGINGKYPPFFYLLKSENHSFTSKMIEINSKEIDIILKSDKSWGTLFLTEKFGFKDVHLLYEKMENINLDYQTLETFIRLDQNLEIWKKVVPKLKFQPQFHHFDYIKWANNHPIEKLEMLLNHFKEIPNSLSKVFFAFLDLDKMRIIKLFCKYNGITPDAWLHISCTLNLEHVELVLKKEVMNQILYRS